MLLVRAINVTSYESVGDHHHGDALAEYGEHERRRGYKRARHAHRPTPVLVT